MSSNDLGAGVRRRPTMAWHVPASTAATAPKLEEPALDRPQRPERERRTHLEVVSTRSQRRARPRTVYAITAVSALLVIVVTQLLLSIGVSQGAYQLSSLQTKQTELQRSYQAASEDLNRLTSPQNLAANANALGMVSNSNPAYLRLSDGAVLGAPVAANGAAGTVTGGQGNLVPNAQLNGVPLVAGQGAAGQIRRIVCLGQAAPGEHAGPLLHPWRDAECGKPLRRLAHGMGKLRAHRFHVPAVAAVLQQGQHQLAREPAAAEGGGDPEIGQPLDPVARRGDEAAAHRRRQRLGKAADVDDAAQSVERGQPRGGRVLEIGEDVVLDDRQSGLVGKLQQPVGDDGRQHRAGRIVQGGICDVEPRPVFGEGLREQAEIRP